MNDRAISGANKDRIADKKLRRIESKRADIYYNMQRHRECSSISCYYYKICAEVTFMLGDADDFDE